MKSFCPHAAASFLYASTILDDTAAVCLWHLFPLFFHPKISLNTRDFLLLHHLLSASPRKIRTFFSTRLH